MKSGRGTWFLLWRAGICLCGSVLCIGLVVWAVHRASVNGPPTGFSVRGTKDSITASGAELSSGSVKGGSVNSNGNKSGSRQPEVANPEKRELEVFMDKIIKSPPIPAPPVPDIKPLPSHDPVEIRTTGDQAMTVEYDIFSANDEVILQGLQTLSIVPEKKEEESVRHWRFGRIVWLNTHLRQRRGEWNVIALPSESSVVTSVGLYEPSGRKIQNKGGDASESAPPPRTTIHTPMKHPSFILTNYSFPYFPEHAVEQGKKWLSCELYRNTEGKEENEAEFQCVGFAVVQGVKTAIIKKRTLAAELSPETCTYYVSLADGLIEYMEYEFRRICVEENEDFRSMLYLKRRR